jgi:hypothetical protein
MVAGTRLGLPQADSAFTMVAFTLLGALLGIGVGPATI